MIGQAPTPPPIPVKKRIPVLAWAGLGCGMLLIIAIVILSLLVGWCKRKIVDPSEFRKNPEKAMAEMVVRNTPGLKLISQNEGNGEMTIRTKDGKEMTLNYKEVSQGKFSVKDANGNVTEIGASDLSKLPSWVPRAPSLKETVSTFQNLQDECVMGGYSGTSTDSLDTLEAFFKTAASKLSLAATSRMSFNTDGNDNRIIAFEAGNRKLNILLNSTSSGETCVHVSYEEKK